MNHKHISVNQLLERLKTQLTKTEEVHIVDYWRTDAYAIGLKRGKKLVYISTHIGVRNNKPDKYDYELEIIRRFRFSNELVKSARNVNEATLVQAIKEYLEV